MKSLSHEKLSPKQEKVFVVLISLFLFMIGLERGGQQLVVADIAALYDMTTEGVGLFASIQHIPPLFAPLIAGIIADRTGKKPMVTIFSFVFALGCVICGFSDSLTVFIIGLVIFATGSCISEMMSTATLSDVNVEKSYQYINISQFMFSVGAVVGPLITEYFIANCGADWSFPFFFSAVGFVIFGVIFILTKFPGIPAIIKSESNAADQSADGNTDGNKDWNTDGDTDTASSGSTKKPGIFMFITPLIICLAVANLLYISNETGYGNFIDSVMRYKNASPSISALTLSAFWAGMAASRLLFSFIKYKPGRVLRICFASSAVLLLVMAFISGGVISVIVSAFIGFAYGPTWCILQAEAAKASEGKSGSAIGLLSLAGGLGGTVMPMIVGFSAMNNATVALIIFAAAAAAGFFLCIKVRDN